MTDESKSALSCRGTSSRDKKNTMIVRTNGTGDLHRRAKITWDISHQAVRMKVKILASVQSITHVHVGRYVATFRYAANQASRSIENRR